MSDVRRARGDEQPVVALIGLGTMGSAMARRILGAGMTVCVWNRSEERTRELSERGAKAFVDAGEAVSGANVVLSVLPTAEVTRAVMIEGRLLEAMANGAIWAQMGTIGVGAIEQIDYEVRKRRPDVLFVDSPVSGSRQPAEAGELEVLASGPDEARPSLTPVFEAIGKKTYWLGSAGAGSRLKLLLNTWLAFQVEGIAETAILAKRLGVSLEVLASSITDGPLASALSIAKLERIRSESYSPDFALKWALKDLDLIGEAAGLEQTPAAQAIDRHWHELIEAGVGDLDVSAAALSS